MPRTSPDQNLKAAFQNYVDTLDALGVWAAIYIPGRERVHVAAGRRAQGDAALIDGSEQYQIGSQTKTFVAIAILLLRREGKLGLDDPVRSLVDLDIDPRVTVRHLIMNTCGLGEYTTALFSPATDFRTRFTPRELVAFSRPAGQLLEPGAVFDYCNTGWVIAAMIVDALAPEGYRGFVHRRIFEPLGMADSRVWNGEAANDRLARAYLRTARFPDLLDTGENGLSWAYGAGDVISTHDDMVAFHRALLTPGNPLGLTFADLTVETARPSARPLFALSLGTEYAYGLERRMFGGRPLWGHPGRTPGYSASTWTDPDAGIVVSTAYTNIMDLTEAPELIGLRYNAGQLFTLVIMTAYALADRA